VTSTVEAEPTAPDSPELPTDWDRFYANYRKPGYIPGYEIGHKLGGGVFGIVYKARKESIGKSYAIKFLKVDDASIRGQVLKELETVKLFAQVDHPNLVSIEDQGVVDGVPYIVMGYAGDETLKGRLEAGAMTEQEALVLFVQIARGVEALHDHSLIHFDLKPANIFLKGDIARVGDYGLSKLITESCMSLSMGRGTPYYMAPEMLHRRGDHRSDIYSLGVILFECLSGEVPFTGESEWQVLKAHEEGNLVFPDSIPPHLRAILAKMLAKDPEDRFQNVRDILDALRSPQRFDAAAGNRSPVVVATDVLDGEADVLTQPHPRRGSLTRWMVGIVVGVLAFLVVPKILMSRAGAMPGASIPIILVVLTGIAIVVGLVFAGSSRRPAGQPRSNAWIFGLFVPLTAALVLTRTPGRQWSLLSILVVIPLVAIAFGSRRPHRARRLRHRHRPQFLDDPTRLPSLLAVFGLLVLAAIGAYLLARG